MKTITKMEVEHFIMKCYRQFSTEKNESFSCENFVFSPTSIYQALLMTASGANGETRQEIMQTLGVDPGKSTCDQTIHQLCHEAFFANWSEREYSEMKAPELNTSNAIYVSDHYQLEDSFQSTIRDTYKGNIESCQMTKANAMNLAGKINEWVAKSTKEKITEIIQPEDIDEETVMFLLNAIYFKGFWYNQFPAGKTREGDFYTHISGTDSIKVQFMQNEFRTSYKLLPALKAKMIGMMFACSNLKMVFILPDAKDKQSFQNLAENLGQPGVLKKTLSQDYWQLAEVDVRLPKFEFDCEISLDTTLQALGMPTAFDSIKADFGKMLKTNGRPSKIFISMIRQKAFLKVDETGAEAAAVTVVRRQLDWGQIGGPMIFNADHPFICAILSAQNVPIFFGHVAHPK